MVSSGVTGMWYKTVKQHRSKLYQQYFLEIYGIPYMKKVTEFRKIPLNFTELYDNEFAEFRRNFSLFRTEYGILKGSKPI
jgi:hypothetical protein